MVKIKALSRDKSEFQRQTKQEIVRAPRSLQPELHPFDKPREFQRALNTVKLNRHFAKPFVAALDGHKDGVCYMAKSEAELVTVCSGSTDGEIRRWNLTERATTWSVAAHTGFVRGIAFAKGGHHFVSASDDKTVKLWSASASRDETEPLSKWLGAHAFTHVDHHDKEHMFATGGPTVQLWDTSRSEAIQSFSWGADTVTRIRFNPVERNLLACLSNDRSITLYDVSSGSAMQKMTMQTRQNSICWNPMEPFHFTTAAEDHDLYTFDMRKLDHAICVHKGHVSAVLDVDYSPTGKQFVSGAYDKTLRIWEAAKPKSVQVYHTKRMQRLFSVLWSADDAYVLSGSDDTNVRLWRSTPNARATEGNARLRRKREYEEALVEKHKHLPAIKRIKNHQHLPRNIIKAAAVKETVFGNIAKRERRRQAHSKPGTVVIKSAKKKKVWKVAS
tara:strand:+ start:474 stop:1808 length:1335 start_codon:yes stop_codon:yes gene_type:complete|mmetsp:Transcript_55186/g.132159  ORF Transcript_55186/g.132159 Transcript_55186/m.132159 type:complete len:445 (-) Transcript_55186:217-1551(-)